MGIWFSYLATHLWFQGRVRGQRSKVIWPNLATSCCLHTGISVILDFDWGTAQSLSWIIPTQLVVSNLSGKSKMFFLIGQRLVLVNSTLLFNFFFSLSFENSGFLDSFCSVFGLEVYWSLDPGLSVSWGCFQPVVFECWDFISLGDTLQRCPCACFLPVWAKQLSCGPFGQPFVFHACQVSLRSILSVF